MLRRVQKNKNCRKQDFEDEANSMLLDKEDTQRRNLNSEYLKIILVVKYPASFICFYSVQCTYS